MKHRTQNRIALAVAAAGLTAAVLLRGCGPVPEPLNPTPGVYDDNGDDLNRNPPAVSIPEAGYSNPQEQY